MPPNNGGQPRRGTGQRRAAGSRTSDTQGNSNPVIQPAVPQPAQTQSSTRQSPNIANQNDAQRPGQQLQQRNTPPLSSPAGRNNVSTPQQYGGAPPTQTPSPARQNTPWGNQNNVPRPGQQWQQRNIQPLSNAAGRNNVNTPQQYGGVPPTQAPSSAPHISPWGNQNNMPRSVQQPVPMITSLSLSELAQNSPSPAQAQSSTHGNSNMANRNNAQRHGQRPEPGIPAPYSGVAGNNVNPSQRSGGTPLLWASVAAGQPSKTTNASLTAGNQAKPEKMLFRSPASKEADTSKATETSYSADGSKLADTPDVAKTSNGAQERSLSKIHRRQNGTPPMPNIDVTDAEKYFITSGFVPTHQDSEICVRPGYGSAGTSIDLQSNYLELKLPSKSLVLYTYKMIVEPDANNQIPKGDRKRQLIRLLLEHHQFQAVLPKVYATDFNSTIITKEPLNFGLVESNENGAKFLVGFKAEGAVYAPVTPISYTIWVNQISVLDISDLDNLLRPNKLISEHHESPMLQALNVILGHHSKKADNIARVGNKRIFPIDGNPQAYGEFDLGGGLIALRGFYANVIGATSRSLVNLNISHGAFYKSRYKKPRQSSLVDLIWARCPGNVNYVDLHHFLRGLRVNTTHLSEEHKAYRKIRTICGLAIEGDGANLDNPPRFRGSTFGGDPWQVEFHEDFATHSSSGTGSSHHLSGTTSGKSRETRQSDSRTGQYITVKDFFTRTYPQHSARIAEDLNCRNPVVNVGTRAKPIYLPAEVCEVLSGQVSRVKLDGEQTSHMIDFAKCDPDKCASFIVDHGRKVLGYAPPSKPMSEFSVTVGHDLIVVPGRILSIPTIEYSQIAANSKKRGLPHKEPEQGSWDIRYMQLYEPVSFVSLKIRCHCLRIAFGALEENLPSKTTFNQLLTRFQSMMTVHGIESKAPIKISHITASVDGVVPKLKAWLDKAFARPSTENQTPAPRVLLIILPSNATEPYRKIKTFADTQEGFHTVCMIGEKHPKGDRKFYANSLDYFANVILKINLKLGGINHKLADRKALGFIEEGTTMVVGIDVTHPSPGSREGAPSIFAVVASMDSQLSQWPVRFGVQRKSREEVISNRSRLRAMFQELLKLWQAKKRSYPKKIIVYRDGVSEGQYSAVIQQELAALKEAYNSLEAEKPQITLIVVAKRHHTRFYPKLSEQADPYKNAKCGTVVDRGITQARTWDFFLQSHSVVSGGPNKPSGTARPAHYVVLHDEIFAGSPKEDRADQLQQITHNMCYLYGPATKAISICPPVYLADKACTRARLYLHEAFGSPNQDEIKKRKDKKDEKNETGEEKAQREEEERIELQSYQDRIQVHKNLKDTMFYI